MDDVYLPDVPSKKTAISAIDVAMIEATVAANVHSMDDVRELEEWRLKAAALEAYLRGRELQRPMLGAQRRIEARIGQLLGPAKEGKPDEHTSTMTEVVRSKDDRADFRILAKAMDGECKLSEDEWRKSRRALVSLLRQRLGLMPETKPLPDGVFRCIVADPPWRLDTGPDVFGGTGESGHDNLAYEQMGLQEIEDLPVEDCAAEDAHLYLWTTNRYIEPAYKIARAWGFKPSVLLVWAKQPHGIGLGDAYRLTTEFILYARRGSLKEMRIVETTWFQWPRGKHSEKPEDFYGIVESMTPSSGGDRLEMFARKPREGWVVWGNEVDETL